MRCITRTAIVAALFLLTFHKLVEASDSLTKQAAAASIWQGFYVGSHFGHGRATPGARLDMQGAADGGQLGYMFQVGHGVLGVEADITTAAIREAASTRFGRYSVTASAGIDVLGSVRCVFGLNAGPALLYGTAGVGFASGTISVSGIGATVSSELSATGYVFGGGVEFRPSRPVGVRVEALRYEFSEISKAGAPFNADLSTTVVRVGVTLRMN